MRCPRCQHENPPDALFCQECGARLEVPCPGCGTGNQPGAKFCKRCGQRLGLASAGQPGPAPPSPATYTPKHLAERILTSKAALEGERKQVTALFADLKGSMELLADRDPEEARKLLDPVLERMMDTVHRYEGTVNQVMGDGIMALFGAPVAHEDHAVRACYAALDMQAAIRRYAEEVWRAHGITAQIRVGVNSGEVVVRAIGSDLHMDYTAVGQTTHLAARMEQLATPGTVLLTADTLRLAEGYVTVKPLGPVPVKGLAAAIEVYELTGAGPLRSRLHAAAARGLTRFVGREGELDQLRQGLGRASEGHGQVVAIVGEPGVGKSRLVWEVTHSHRVHGWLVLQAGSVSYGKATSYLPVIDLLKRYFTAEDRDGPRVVQEKMTGKLLTLDRALEASLPALLSLLDVPTDDPQWPTLDPPQRRRRTLDAVKRLLLRESQVQPLLVVFEDLHWIDSETQALLDGLVESLPAARLLLLVNYRPEYQHPWGSRTYYTQLRLDPLPPESAEELLGALFGPDPGLDPLKRVLIARTEGNPFFLEESVRGLVETGPLSGERGAYRLARPLPAVQVPATVQAVLAARIDRLPPGDKALLQTASVVGKDVPFTLLQAIAEPAEDELHAAIGRLQAAEFLYEAGIFPDLEYTFKHALTHEVAYVSLLQERRRALHARIGDIIERLYPDRITEWVDILAHHALRGEKWEKAAGYLWRAGRKASARSAHREAVASFEQALRAVDHLPQGREAVEQSIDIRFDLRNSLVAVPDFGPLLQYLREAEALANALDDQARLARVSSYLTHHFWVVGDYDRALERGHHALAVAKALGDVPIQVATTFFMGWIHHARGDFALARDLLAENVRALTGEPEQQYFGLPVLPSVSSRTWLVWCLMELGRFAEGIAYGEDAIRIARASGQPWALADAYVGLGALYLRQGHLREAVPLLETAFRACESGDIGIVLPAAASLLGSAYALSKRFGEAVPLLERGICGKAILSPAALLTALGEGYLLRADIAAARLHLADALQLARQHKERGNEARALQLVGEAMSNDNPPAVSEAGTHYRKALALANELGMPPLIAHCHLGLGKLYRRTGKPQEAQEHLTTATTMYRQMGMAYWLEQAEAERDGGTEPEVMA
jgi:class 3 adenylate cyclase/tetratricopeptide (TPR) repeat protein